MTSIGRVSNAANQRAIRDLLIIDDTAGYDADNNSATFEDYVYGYEPASFMNSTRFVSLSPATSTAINKFNIVSRSYADVEKIRSGLRSKLDSTELTLYFSLRNKLNDPESKEDLRAVIRELKEKGLDSTKEQVIIDLLIIDDVAGYDADNDPSTYEDFVSGYTPASFMYNPAFISLRRETSTAINQYNIRTKTFANVEEIRANLREDLTEADLDIYYQLRAMLTDPESKKDLRIALCHLEGGSLCPSCDSTTLSLQAGTPKQITIDGDNFDLLTEGGQIVFYNASDSEIARAPFRALSSTSITSTVTIPAGTPAGVATATIIPTDTNVGTISVEGTIEITAADTTASTQPTIDSISEQEQAIHPGDTFNLEINGSHLGRIDLSNIQNDKNLVLKNSLLNTAEDTLTLVFEVPRRESSVGDCQITLTNADTSWTQEIDRTISARKNPFANIPLQASLGIGGAGNPTDSLAPNYEGLHLDASLGIGLLDRNNNSLALSGNFEGFLVAGDEATQLNPYRVLGQLEYRQRWGIFSLGAVAGAGTATGSRITEHTETVTNDPTSPPGREVEHEGDDSNGETGSSIDLTDPHSSTTTDYQTTTIYNGMALRLGIEPRLHLGKKVSLGLPITFNQIVAEDDRQSDFALSSLDTALELNVNLGRGFELSAGPRVTYMPGTGSWSPGAGLSLSWANPRKGRSAHALQAPRAGGSRRAPDSARIRTEAGSGRIRMRNRTFIIGDTASSFEIKRIADAAFAQDCQISIIGEPDGIELRGRNYSPTSKTLTIEIRATRRATPGTYTLALEHEGTVKAYEIIIEDSGS